MERVKAKILGIDVDTFTFDEALAHIWETKGQVVTINPEMISTAQQNNDFKKLVDEASLIIPDGIGVQIGLKLLGHNVRRIAGIEFGKAFIKKCCEEGKTIAMVGAKKEVVELATKNLTEEFSGLKIAYSHDGYFSDSKPILDEVVNASPDVVLVALGSPKQEFFIKELKTRLPQSIFIGLGGSFDVWAGVVKRAPEIYQKMGLEWLYRTVKEPQRFKRIFPTLPLFVLKVLKERLWK